LINALAEVCNEETRLRDVGLLRSSSVLAARSSTTCPTAPVPLVSHSVAPHPAHGESAGLHCDHCGRDGHVETFSYRKRKVQKAYSHRSSQGTGGTCYEGSERSSAISETQVLIMLLCGLVALRR
jgi:hypothetical protein